MGLLDKLFRKSSGSDPVPPPSVTAPRDSFSCPDCGSQCSLAVAPFSSAMTVVRCPKGHYTAAMCVACKKGAMTRVSDLDFTVSTVCSACGHASSGIPKKWWYEEAERSDEFQKLRRVHNAPIAPPSLGVPTSRAELHTETVNAGSGTDESFRRAAASHLNSIVKEYVGRDLQRSGAPAEKDADARVQVKAVEAFLDQEGRTVLRVNYVAPAGMSIDADKTRRILCGRLMEFYSRPLGAAKPEHGVGIVEWTLGPLALKPGQII